MRRASLSILVVASVLLCSGVLLKTLAAEGFLDNTFGGGSGTMTTDFGGSNDQAHAVAIQPDGRIVVVGETNSDGNPNHNRSALARYTRDGMPDTTFGNGGIVISTLQPNNYAYAVAVQPDGKILTAGVGLADLTRYNSDGSLDTTFGSGGYTGTVLRAFALRLLPDGKILVGGYVPVTYQNTDFAVARYNADGTLDTTFGNNGRSTIEFQGGHDEIHALAIAPDGKIVAAGWSDCCGSNWYFAVARYNVNGTVDTGFGNNGRTWTNLSPDFGMPYHRAYAVAVQPDGKIVAAGGSRHYDDTDSFGIVRYNKDGSLDNTFGSGGRVLTKFSGNSSTANAIALRRDGKIFVGGESNGFFALARYNRDGSLDTSFGNHNGQASTQVFGNSGATAMTLQPDGNVVLAGKGFINSYDFALARFTAKGNGPPSFDFNGDGKADPSIFCPGDSTWEMMLTGGNVSRRQWGLGGDKQLTGDYDGDGLTDIALYRPTEGNWYILQSSTNSVRVQGWGISGDVPVPADYDGDGKTDVAIFRPSESNWYIIESGGGGVARGWGINGDVPVPVDYDGDGRADIAVFRPAEGTWYIIQSGGGGIVRSWGQSGDRLVPADYDGDGRTDLAVFRPSEGNWYILQSSAGAIVRGWGLSTDKPVPADYDGDGKADIAVWRESEGTWYIIESSTNAMTTAQLGSPGDVPLPAN